MLVSIIVITYNSSKYVLETLESAYRQTYNDIELIVSDDCSTDNTFELCQQWVEEHKDRFVRTLCTQTPHNGGIVWNYNHALKHVNGEWIKYIAGDDILDNNCIERYVANIQQDHYIYTCSQRQLSNNKIIHPTVLNIPQKQQVRDALRYHHAAYGPSLFFERKHLIKLDGFDTRFPMLEDETIVYRYLINGYRIGIIDEVLVTWRDHNESVSHSYSIFTRQMYQVKNYYGLHYCWRYGLILHSYNYWVRNWIDKHYESGRLYKFIGYIFQCTNIVHIYRKYIKR